MIFNVLIFNVYYWLELLYNNDEIENIIIKILT